MKKINFALLLCLLFHFFVFAQKQTQKELMRLKGNVQSVETYLISAKDGKFDESNRKQMGTYIFTPKGDVKEFVYFNEQGIVTGKTFYEFDLRGNNTTSQEYHPFDAKTIPTTKIKENVYDDKGNLIEVRGYDSKEKVLVSTTNYKYDEKGNNIEMNFGNLSGTIHRYSYDKKRNLIESLFYTGETLNYKTVITYDKKNRILTKETIGVNPINYFPRSKPIPERTVYTYNDAKREATINSYYPDNSLKEHATFNYDKRGNIVKTISQYFDSKKNSNGEIKTIAGIFRISELEYDAQNNWIKNISSTQLQKDSPVVPDMLEVRIIKYIR